MVIAAGGVVWWYVDDANAKADGTGTVTCTNGTVVDKNGYYLIKNVKKGAVVTISYRDMVNGYWHKSFVHGIIIV